MSSFIIRTALFGFLPAGLLLVAWLRPVRGIVATFVLGWLFLPVASVGIQGFPDYTKGVAIALAAALGIVAFDSRRLLEFRPGWIDIPICIWCMAPFAASVTNGLGPWDGTSSMVSQLIYWGIPWFVGRLYFTTQDGLRDLALGIVFGGLVYVPLCLFEAKMSPQLNYWVYGFFAGDFQQSKRFEGWRPTVFLQHGLAVGLYMCSAAFACWWLWSSGIVRRILRCPAWWSAAALLGTAVLCRSAGAIAVLLALVAACLAGRALRVRVLFLALLAFAPVYVALRAPNLWSGRAMVSVIEPLSSERAASLETRLKGEDVLAAHALEQPVFGWASWGRNLVYTESGSEQVAPDQLWIIVLGQQGLVGLAAMLATFLLAPWLYVRRLKASQLFDREHAPATATVGLVACFVIDCLFNAMPNPMYALAAGALGSFVVASSKRRAGPPAAVRRGGVGGGRRLQGNASRAADAAEGSGSAESAASVRRASEDGAATGSMD